ncbi:MAG: hypothetical protein RLZZ09_166, partial [Pseudomonadota bacterium]
MLSVSVMESGHPYNCFALPSLSWVVLQLSSKGMALPIHPIKAEDMLSRAFRTTPHKPSWIVGFPMIQENFGATNQAAAHIASKATPWRGDSMKRARNNERSGSLSTPPNHGIATVVSLLVWSMA